MIKIDKERKELEMQTMKEFTGGGGAPQKYLLIGKKLKLL